MGADWPAQPGLVCSAWGARSRPCAWLLPAAVASPLYCIACQPNSPAHSHRPCLRIPACRRSQAALTSGVPPRTSPAWQRRWCTATPSTSSTATSSPRICCWGSTGTSRSQTLDGEWVSKRVRVGDWAGWAGRRVRSSGWEGGIPRLHRMLRVQLSYFCPPAPLPLPAAGRCTRPTAGARRCAAR